MAGNMVQVDTETITTNVSEVILTGINTDEIYFCTFNNVSASNDNQGIQIRVGKSGVLQSDSNYRYQYLNLRTDTTYSETRGTNAGVAVGNSGTNTGETGQGIVYLYNFNSSNEFSSYSIATSFLNASPHNTGAMGGIQHAVNSASDSIGFTANSGDLASGTFTLYKLVGS